LHGENLKIERRPKLTDGNIPQFDNALARARERLDGTDTQSSRDDYQKFHRHPTYCDE
jgi:hypothetical protein